MKTSISSISEGLSCAVPLFCCICPSQHVLLFSFGQSKMPWLEQKSSSAFFLLFVQLVPPGGVKCELEFVHLPVAAHLGWEIMDLAHPGHEVHLPLLWAQLQFFGSSHSPSLRIKSTKQVLEQRMVVGWRPRNIFLPGLSQYLSMLFVLGIFSLPPDFPCENPNFLPEHTFPSPHPKHPLWTAFCCLVFSSTGAFAVCGAADGCSSCCSVPSLDGNCCEPCPVLAHSLFLSGFCLPQGAHFVVVMIKSPLHRAGLSSAPRALLVQLPRKVQPLRMLWSPPQCPAPPICSQQALWAAVRC